MEGAPSYHVCFMRILKPSGQVEGTGRCRLLLPTPQMMAEESTSLYGISPVSSSHRTTPNDLPEKRKQIRRTTLREQQSNSSHRARSVLKAMKRVGP